jgi:hypothetical protein
MLKTSARAAEKPDNNIKAAADVKSFFSSICPIAN